MSAQNFLESAQNFDFETQNWQNSHFLFCWYNLTKFFVKYSLFFMAILVHNSAQNQVRLNSDRTKEFTFRMSAGLVTYLAGS